MAPNAKKKENIETGLRPLAKNEYGLKMPHL